ncbi:FAD:protein FMN transferase [Luedemannella flava]
MGTAISLDIADPLPPDELAAATDEVFAWLRLVDARFSTYRDDSEVSLIGALPEARRSADLRHVLDECARLWETTGGYFDAYATGRFDPSGYVKGWSVRVASEQLAARGVGNHCLNAGGDVCLRGRSSSGRPWRVGIRHPSQASGLSWVLELTDAAVATSGSYERGPHVVDPFTGRGATALRSVTVVGPDLGVADAYATAAMAMGRAGVAWLAELPDHEFAVVADDGRTYRSAGLPAVA